MKKLTKKMKGKKVLSLVLAAIMLATTVSVALPHIKLDTKAADVQRDADGNIVIDGVTQKPIVTDNNTTAILNTQKYDEYAASYLGGSSYSTGIVIPGLDSTQDYVIQGMTYYPDRDWFLVTAYHNADTDNGETAASSKIFALDAATGDFVAMFSFKNVDGTTNTDHGGGIAVSEYNIYYSCGDKDRKIAYAPLSKLAEAPLYEHTVIDLVAEVDFVEVGSVSGDDSKTAYTAYVCYDEGILWMGNFYDVGADLAGFTIAAADYNAPASSKFNSMVFGYKLEGSSSPEEWANLTNSDGSDCQGSPSYAIGLNNALKDVQYAVVDNGKLYLSRSYGSGSGNSLTFGFGETSTLTIADIDLSVPGDTDVTISTTSTDSLDKTIKAYNITDYDNYSMMPMSEGLCFVDDELFITFEGASNKYLTESDGTFSIGNCEKPVDVIWQVNPYELMEVEVAEPEKSIYYEKVYSLSDIENDEEYLIVFESAEKDLVTQENILYALNADGNFKDYKLSKGSTSTVKGYNGMIGHVISDYDLIDNDDDGNADILYLNDPDNDDVENVRWTLTNVSGTNYKIATTEPYFANCNYLYFDEDQIGMLPSNSGYLLNVNIIQLTEGNGNFYFHNNGYYLWCNSGLNTDYNNKINSYYTQNSGTAPIYSGITEQDGTIHCDALNTAGNNVIGQSIPAGDDNTYPDGTFHIYKRVVDNVASTYESRVYTNLDSELQADGTYTINLETYAISPNHYKYVGEKPTDYIVVADTSKSMENTGSTGYIQYPGDLKAESFFTEEQLANDVGKPSDTDGSGDGNPVIGYSYTDEDIYYEHTDGKFYRLQVALRNKYSYSSGFLGIGKGWSFKGNYFYLYYIADDGKYYCFTNTESTPSLTYTQEEFKAWVANENGVVQTASSTASGKSDRINEWLCDAVHYRFDNVNSPFTTEHQRISTLKTATANLIGQLAAENSNNRIALVQFGADASSGYYNTSGTLSQSGYTDAFWSAGNASTLQTTASNLTTSEQTSSDGIEFTHVNNIITQSVSDGAIYKGEDSNRNIAIIYLSDGVAGADTLADADKVSPADAIILKALTAKQAGAFIYTVMIGADGTAFKRNIFMEAVSSKYPDASSMTSLGGQSVDGISYALSLATINMNNFVNFGSVVLEETSQNNAVALENLDANSYLREQLSEAFKFPADNADGTKNYDIAVELVPGVFDKIGRFAFDEENADEQVNGAAGDVSWTEDTTNNTITLTNYDYSEQYISKNKATPGNKLKVTITGLLANESANIQNTSINNTDTTAIYKTAADMNKSTAENDLSFKKLPTEYFNIPEYTYVLDYGVDLYDSDINGTMLALDKGLNAQPKISENEYDYRDESQSGLIEMTNSNQDLIYKMNPTSTGDTGYVLIQRPEGTYDWFKLNVVPASNVYYEEDRIATSGTSGKIEWTQTGTTEGVYRDVTIETDVYGYDKHYDDASQQFSNNSHLRVDVTNEKDNTTSKKKSFTFTGTGFDLMSACGTNTGVLSVAVKDENGKRVKGFMVDTYYNDANVSTLLSQVPVVSWSGDYGTYTVDIAAIYVANAGGVPKSVAKNNLINTGLVMNSAEPADTADIAAILKSVGMEDMIADDMELVWFDDNSIFNGGTGVAPTVKKTREGDEATVVTLQNYIDGFRVYNPLGTDQSAYEDSEKNAKYVNVLGNLMNKTGTVGSIAYIVGQNDTLTWEDYETVGPQDELYLKNGASVSFSVTVDQIEKIMLGLRAVNGATKVTIANSANDAYKVENVSINSATEMYYDITKCFGTISGNDQAVTITVTNTGDKILAVNHIKHSGGDGSVGSGIVTRTNARSAAATQAQDSLFAPFTEDNLVDVQNSMNLPGVQGIVKNGVIIPLVEDENDVTGDNTTPDVPGDDTNNDNNDDTNTDSGEAGDFSIFSLLEMLISLIEKILYKAFGAGKMA